MAAPKRIKKFGILVEEGAAPGRLDSFLAQKLSQFSRSQIQKWMRDGHVLMDGRVVIPSQPVVPGLKVQVFVPPEVTSLVPEKIPLEILFEDPKILVVNKPRGMVTHPAQGNLTGTLANAAAFHLQKSGDTPLNSAELSGVSPKLPHRRSARKGQDPHSFRPGIVHRLDKDTSGVMVLAKDTKTLETLARQFEKRTVEKVYRAVVQGSVSASRGEIVGSIGKDYNRLRMAVTSGGRYARTDFKVLKAFPESTYLEVYPKTGRTHQIRVHLAQIGHPVLGDPIYSNGKSLVPRLMLHAYSLSFRHPSKKKKMTFIAPLPEDFQKVLKAL